jgi:hypothetical protein
LRHQTIPAPPQPLPPLADNNNNNDGSGGLHSAVIGLRDRLSSFVHHDHVHGHRQQKQQSPPSAATATPPSGRRPTGAGDVIDNPKWLPTSRTLQRCFPAMASWDFSLGKGWADFDDKWDEMATLLEEHQQQEHQQQQQQEAPVRQRRRELSPNVRLINGRTMIGREGTDEMKEPVTGRDIQEGLEAFARYWRNNGRLSQSTSQSNNNNTDEGMQQQSSLPASSSNSGSLLTVPFLFSDSMDDNVLVDRYLPVLRELFRVHPGCCPPPDELPRPDESVFHYRNFAREFRPPPPGSAAPGAAYEPHPYDVPTFEEVTPNQTVHVLFPHLGAGDRVVIATRPYAGPAAPARRDGDGAGGGSSRPALDKGGLDPLVLAHVRALEERGIRVRVLGHGRNGGGTTGQENPTTTTSMTTKVRNGTSAADGASSFAFPSPSDLGGGIRDFCFLLHAQKELVGSYRSTFAYWAAVLGGAGRAVLYTIRSPPTKARFGPYIKSRFQYRWEHDESLRGRVQMVLLPMERRGPTTAQP